MQYYDTKNKKSVTELLKKRDTYINQTLGPMLNQYIQAKFGGNDSTASNGMVVQLTKFDIHGPKDWKLRTHHQIIAELEFNLTINKAGQEVYNQPLAISAEGRYGTEADKTAAIDARTKLVTEACNMAISKLHEVVIQQEF